MRILDVEKIPDEEPYGELRAEYRCSYDYDFSTGEGDKEIIVHEMAVSAKSGRFHEMMERSVYQILRWCLHDKPAYHRLPSTCGFFYWHTFQKLRPWIRENSDYFLCIEGVAEDGTVIQAEYSENERNDHPAMCKVYARNTYLGSVRIYPGGPADICTYDDLGYLCGGDDSDYCVGGLKDFEQEIALAEKFYLSKQLMTETMEKALMSYQYDENRRKADEKVIAMYYYNPKMYIDSEEHYSVCRQPFQYYIIRGERCGENGWRLYGLIYTLAWEWREILVGECEDEIPALPLPPRTLRKIEVFGQRLEDVLKQYGYRGWENLLD